MIFGVTSSILEVSGLESHSRSTDPVNFHGAQSSLKEAQFSFGGAQAVIWGERPRKPPPRGAGPGMKLLIGNLLTAVKFFCKSLLPTLQLGQLSTNGTNYR